MDTIQSTKEALNLAKALENVAKLRAELEDMQVQLALLKAETAQNIETAKAELRETVAESVEAHKEMVAARKEALEDAVAAGKEKTGRDGCDSKDRLAETAAAHREMLATAAEIHKEAIEARKEELVEAVEAHRETVAARRRNCRNCRCTQSCPGCTHQHTERKDERNYPSLKQQKKNAIRPSILRRNPTAVSRRFADAWKELYNEWEKQKHA